MEDVNRSKREYIHTYICDVQMIFFLSPDPSPLILDTKSDLMLIFTKMLIYTSST